MSVDWITVIAQLLNFIVLVWLLQRVLYRPVLAAIGNRQAAIDARLEAADRAKRDADTARNQLQDAKTAFEQEKDALLDTARREAGELEARLAAEARIRDEMAHEALLEEMKADREDALNEALMIITKRFFKIIEKALKELVDHDLEPELATHWATTLEKQIETQPVSPINWSSNEQSVVTTSAPLPEKTQEQLRACLQRLSKLPLAVVFRVAPEAEPYVRFSYGKASYEWSLQQYLDSLRRDLERELRLETFNPEPIRSESLWQAQVTRD